jgi:hypothetical protein
MCGVLNGAAIVEKCPSITFWLIRNARETTQQEHRRTHILQESHKFSRFLLFFYEFEDIDLDYAFNVPRFYEFT